MPSYEILRWFPHRRLVFLQPSFGSFTDRALSTLTHLVLVRLFPRTKWPGNDWTRRNNDKQSIYVERLRTASFVSLNVQTYKVRGQVVFSQDVPWNRTWKGMVFCLDMRSPFQFNKSIKLFCCHCTSAEFGRPVNSEKAQRSLPVSCRVYAQDNKGLSINSRCTNTSCTSS